VTRAIGPGATIGVLGGGQLGRMLALAARRMGYRVHMLAPEPETPTGQVADRVVAAPYADLDAVRAFARQVDVVTFEFENVPAAAAAAAADISPVRPSSLVLHTAQNRIREKTFLTNAGFPVTPFVPILTLEDLRSGLGTLGCPAVLKTAESGYDGKGQVALDTAEAAEAAWRAIGGRAAVLEPLVDFDREISVVAARGIDGSLADYGAIENTHRAHILDLSCAPARVPPGIAREATRLARAVLTELDVVGVVGVECFVTRDGRILVNELAPRPHNSGHLTIEASVTSQFEQQLRAVCGLPLGSTEQLRPAAMANLLGDLWRHGEPEWSALGAFPAVKLHLYGKGSPRPGRKMGHLTVLGSTVEDASTTVVAARAVLTRSPDGSAPLSTLPARPPYE
jgi:5-(carboxyamino)imidazole ribonucleotide synthase